MTFYRKPPFRVIAEKGSQLVECYKRAVLQMIARGPEQYVMGDEIDLFGVFFPDHRRGDNRAAMVFNGSGAVGTLVFFVVHSVMVRIGHGTAIVTGYTGDRLTGIVLIVDAVMVGVGHGAPMPGLCTGLEG